MTKKACTKCGIIKPLNQFHKDRKTQDGHKHKCRVCANAQVRALFEQNREKYYANSRAKYGERKDKINAQRREFYAENREEIRARDNKRFNTPEYKAYKRRYDKKYTERNKAKKKQRDREYYQKNKEQIKARVAEYAKENRKHLNKSANARWHERRSRIESNGGSYTPEEWENLKAVYDHRCLACGKREPEITLTVDHVVTIARGGTNDISNIQPLCSDCNCSKWAYTIDYRPYYSYAQQDSNL